MSHFCQDFFLFYLSVGANVASCCKHSSAGRSSSFTEDEPCAGGACGDGTVSLKETQRPNLSV